MELLSTFQASEYRIWQSSYIDENTIIVCGAKGEIRIWTKKGKCGRKEWQCIENVNEATQCHKRTVRALKMSPERNRFVTAGFDGVCGIWEREDSGSWACVSTLEGHENEIKSVDWHKTENLIATCGRDKAVWIWMVHPDNDFECLAVLQEHSQDVKKVLFHPFNEILFSCSYDNTIKVWKCNDDDDDWFCEQTLNKHTATVWSIDVSQNGEDIVSCGDDLMLCFWKYNPSSDEYEFSHSFKTPHERTIFCAKWNPVHVNLLISSSADNSIVVYSNSEQVQVLAHFQNAHDVDINYLEWHPSDPLRFVSCDDQGIVKEWTLKSSTVNKMDD